MLLRHFWLVCGAIWALNLMLWKRRLDGAVGAGVLDQSDSRRFLFVSGAAVGLMCLAMQSIGLWTGTDPIRLATLGFGDRGSSAVTALMLVTWIAVLWWVWLGRGAVLLGRVAPILRAGHQRAAPPLAPAVVRLVVTAGVAVTAAAAGFASTAAKQSVPVATTSEDGSPERGCSTPERPAEAETPAYQVVFDARDQGIRPWEGPGFGLLFVAIGACWLTYRRAWPVARNRFDAAFPYVWTGFAVLWTLAVSAVVMHDYLALVNALEEGRYDVVEGPVEQFVPMPKEGHTSERFVVDGRRYSYSDFEITTAFNNTSSHGGPIRQGLRVRIFDVNGNIARLEVAR